MRPPTANLTQFLLYVKTAEDGEPMPAIWGEEVYISKALSILEDWGGDGFYCELLPSGLVRPAEELAQISLQHTTMGERLMETGSQLTQKRWKHPREKFDWNFLAVLGDSLTVPENHLQPLREFWARYVSAATVGLDIADKNLPPQCLAILNTRARTVLAHALMLERRSGRTGDGPGPSRVACGSRQVHVGCYAERPSVRYQLDQKSRGVMHTDNWKLSSRFGEAVANSVHGLCDVNFSGKSHGFSTFVTVEWPLHLFDWREVDALDSVMEAWLGDAY